MKSGAVTESGAAHFCPSDRAMPHLQYVVIISDIDHIDLDADGLLTVGAGGRTAGQGRQGRAGQRAAGRGGVVIDRSSAEWIGQLLGRSVD